MGLSALVSVFLAGLTTAMLLFMIASGLTLVFGVMRVINFAHGAFYMLGAYFGLTVQAVLGGPYFWLTLSIATVAVALLSGFVEWAFLRRIYKSDHIYQLLLTYSLVLVIDALVKMLWGLDPQSLSEPPLLSGSWELLGRPVPVYAIFTIFVGLFLSVARWLFLSKNKYGLYIRAAAEDVDTTNTLGINVPMLFTGVFLAGSWLAALGGILAAPLRVISPDMGTVIIIECFAVVVIGGMGSLQGAFVGAILIGMLNAFGDYFLPGLSMIFVYLLMAAVLVAKPTGLFGARN